MMRKEFVYSNWRYKFQVRLDDEEEWYEASSVIVGKAVIMQAVTACSMGLHYVCRSCM